MIPRIVLLGITAFAVFGIADAFLYKGSLASTVQNVKSSIEMIAYTDEISEIPNVVDEFLYLRTIRGTEGGNDLAAKMDEKINNFDLVKMYCNQRISTLELAYENDPYEKLQQLCPSLKSVSFSKAAELFRLI